MGEYHYVRPDYPGVVGGAVTSWSRRSHLLGGVNIWVLLLIIPVQFASYYASAEIFCTYLRGRGQLRRTTPIHVTAVALEYNFVNHVFSVSWCQWCFLYGMAPG